MYGSYSTTHQNYQPTQSSSNPFEPSTLGDFSGEEVFGSAYNQAQNSPFENVTFSEESKGSASSQQRTSAVVVDNNPFAAPSSSYSPATYAPQSYSNSYSPASYAQPVPPSEESQPFIAQEGQQEQPTGESGGTEEGARGNNYYPWQKQYWQRYFNVDQKEVGRRMSFTITPWRLRFIAAISQNPDMYGPFWITTTVAFIIAMTSNLHEFFVSHSTHWQYDPTKIAAAPAVLFGYVLVIPFVLWLVLKYIDAPLKLMELICVYGYAMIWFFPSSIICIFANDVVKWFAIIIAAALSGFFIVANLFVALKDRFLKRGLLISIVLIAFHLGLTLTLLLYFFGNKIWY
jgi:cation transporter-like permease